mgnify:CR=1 FL=1
MHVIEPAASGRAKAMEQTTGMVKIISAEDDDEVLGVGATAL